MTDLADILNSRVAALEAVSATIRAVHVKGLQCDDGPYDAEALAEGWVEEGVFESGSSRFEGKGAIKTFYSALSAVFTMHYYTNLIITPGPSKEPASIELYGFETPVIKSRAAVGFFTHHATCYVSKNKCLWKTWRQKVYAIAPFVEGWENGERVLNQNR